MIVKSMARKSLSFGQLLRYIDGPKEKGTALLHNFGPAASPAEIRQEMIRNAHLLPARKNGNVLYHEVLSFAAADRERIDAGTLTDLTRRYLELRAPYALAYARAHLDTENPHVHLAISANNVGDHQRLRLSKRQFREVQLEIERYQQKTYPLLGSSLAQEPRSPAKVHTTRPEQERKRRGAQAPSRKEELRQMILGELSAAESGPDCYQRLLKHGLRLYRRGQSIGVEELPGGRRYRLRTLGLAEAFERSLAAWKRLPERLRSLPGPARSPPGERSRDPPPDR